MAAYAQDQELVFAVVLNWNGASDTSRCIRSLVHSNSEHLSIVVCDNKSTDDSIARLQEEFLTIARESLGKWEFVDLSGTPSASITPRAHMRGKIFLLQSGRNGGYATGNNVGLRFGMSAGAQYLWILNNDTYVEPNSLPQLIKRMNQDPSIGICGGTLIYDDESNRVQAYAGSHFNKWKGLCTPIGQWFDAAAPVDVSSVEEKLSCINGACVFVSRDYINIVGYMCERYFLYWEEMDWFTSANRKFRAGFAANARIYHKVGSSIGTRDAGRSSLLSEYYINRNAMWYCWRHSKISIPAVVYRHIRNIVVMVCRADKPRALNLMRALFNVPFRSS